MIRAVIDTNVLVSGLLAPAGNEASVLVAIQEQFVRPIVSDAILAEYVDVLGRRKFGFALHQIETLRALFQDRGEHVIPARSTTTSPDPGDTIFIRCAESAGADYIITGNRRHFPNAVYGTARVMNASEWLRHFASAR